jgi:hypothetical protein
VKVAEFKIKMSKGSSIWAVDVVVEVRGNKELAEKLLKAVEELAEAEEWEVY